MGILILIGGGICLSEGFIQSGLAELMANLFIRFAERPLVVIVLMIALFITFINKAMASIMTDGGITSVSMGISPLI